MDLPLAKCPTRRKPSAEQISSISGQVSVIRTPNPPLDSSAARAAHRSARPGEFEAMTDDELKRAIVERFIRLGFAAKLAISARSRAPNGAATRLG